MERLYEIHAAGGYDLIVVDTPPTRNALDFLEAPDRMAEFFSSRLLRWLTVPYRVAAASPWRRSRSTRWPTASSARSSSRTSPSSSSCSRRWTTGFVKRAEAVEPLLPDRRTTFVVVTTLEAAPAHEAEFFIQALDDRKLHLGAVVLNKVLPAALLDPTAPTPPARLAANADDLAARAGHHRWTRPTARWRGCSSEVADSFLNFQVVAKREAEQRAELARRARGHRGRALLRRGHPRPRRPRPHGRAALALAARRRADRPDWWANGHPRRTDPSPLGARRRGHRPPPTARGRMGDARRLLLRRPPAATSPTDATAPLAGGSARCGRPPARRSTWPTGRHVGQRHRAAAAELGRPRRASRSRARCRSKASSDAARMLAIPVRRGGRTVAVLTKEWSPRVGRQPGELERTYQAIFHRFAGDDRRRHVPVQRGEDADRAPPRASATA